MFEYWHPTRIEPITEGGAVCQVCGAKDVLFPLYHEIREGENYGRPGDVIVGACERCIKSGVFVFNEWERSEQASQLMRCGIPQDKLENCIRILEQHPRPRWARQEWPAHCGGLADYLGEWQPRDFLQRKASDTDDNTWFQARWMLAQPGVAQVYDVTLPTRKLLFFKRERALRDETWTVEGAVLHAFECSKCSQLLPMYALDV